MTETTAYPPRTAGEILDRAGRPDFDRWADQVQRCGYCARPVQLRGRVVRRTANGAQQVYATGGEPDRVLLIRCGNRRASVCPSCSREYAGDMWNLLYAGAAGGRKGVPESVRAHPLVFATLTAPGFGRVHTTRTDRRGQKKAGRCRMPRGPLTLCPHGRPSWCGAVHPDGDPKLGQPLCVDCYDYPAHVAFNWYAPELWRRFTITLRRVLARRCGLSAAEFTRRCRLSFVKVAEFQRRGVVHFHALIRLDAASAGFAPPPVPVGGAELAEAIQEAAGLVRLTVELPGGALVLRLGEQTDTQVIGAGPAGELTPEHVASYLAKYATKSADELGLDGRIASLAALDRLDISEHVARIVRTAWDLSKSARTDHSGPADGKGEAGAAGESAGMRRWLHTLAFRGHFSTKSRRYSTTLGAIRNERREFRRRQAAEHAREIGADTEDDATLLVGSWEFAGLGYLTGGDAALALSAAARARERRQAARDEIA